MFFSGLQPFVDTSPLNLSIRSRLPLVHSVQMPLVYLHCFLQGLSMNFSCGQSASLADLSAFSFKSRFWVPF